MIPTVFRAIAHPDCSPEPTPFTGDPYKAALPLLDRLEEILSAYKPTDYSDRSHSLRERILGLAYRVPEWHNRMFQAVVAEARKILENLPPPIVKWVEEEPEGFPKYNFTGIGLERACDEEDAEQAALALLRPLLVVLKHREGEEIECWRLLRPEPSLLVDMFEAVYLGEMPVLFRANEHQGFLTNTFRIGCLTSTKALPCLLPNVIPDWQRIIPIRRKRQYL